MMQRLIRVGLALLALVSRDAIAQSIYVDFGFEYGGPTPPSSSYGAAVGVPGYWNEVQRGGPFQGQPLLDVDQQPTQAAFWTEGCDSNAGALPNGSPDHKALLDDWFYYDCLAPPWTDEVRGLQAGTYQLVVYPVAQSTGTATVGLPSGGTVDGGSAMTFVNSGPFPGSFVDWFVGVKVIHLPNSNSTVQLTVATSSSGLRLTGMQLVRLADATPFCFGHLGGCPCGVGQPGAGCPSSFNASGAPLSGTGSLQVSNDTLQFTATGVLSSGFCLLFQGTTAPGDGLGVLFGDGLRCAGGPLKRIASKSAVGGVFQYPLAGDPSVSVRGAVPVSGGFRAYQLRYRNAASYCTADTFNSTNGVAVEWLP